MIGKTIQPVFRATNIIFFKNKFQNKSKIKISIMPQKDFTIDFFSGVNEN